MGGVRSGSGNTTRQKSICCSAEYSGMPYVNNDNSGDDDGGGDGGREGTRTRKSVAAVGG